MSVNRENVTWQTEDGRWSIGFWDFDYVGGDDGDYEWDVEYLDHFNFASTGHATEEAAYAAYTRENANPGGTVVYPWSEANRDRIEGFNKLAADWKRQHAADQAELRRRTRSAWTHRPYRRF